MSGRSSGPTYHNPLFTKRTWQIFVIERLDFFGWLTILLAIGIFYLIFYSPYLQITRLNIGGTQNISAKVLDEKFIRWQMQQRRWLVFRQSNILMFSKKWLTERINEQYRVESIKIDKKLPHTLSLTITEKKPELVWSTAGKYYFLDESGKISQLLENADMASELDLIADESNSPVSPGQDVIKTDQVDFIKKLIKAMEQQSSMEIASYSMPNNLNTQVNVQIKDKYKIYFDSSKNLDSQLAKLNGVLTTVIPETNPKEYVDLRIGDRVYMK